MKFLRIVFFIGVLTGSLFAQTKYNCHIKKVFDANSLRVYDSAGIQSIDTMILTLQNDVLIHKVEGKPVKYRKQSSGVTSTRSLQNSSFFDVRYSEYKTEETLPMIIYALNDFKRIIRIDFDQIYAYDCVEF